MALTSVICVVGDWSSSERAKCGEWSSAPGHACLSAEREEIQVSTAMFITVVIAKWQDRT